MTDFYKNSARIIAAFVLAACFVLPFCAAFAFSADIFSSPDFSFEPASGVVYKEKSIVENGSAQSLFYGEYKSDENSQYAWVVHSVRNGTKTTRTTVKAIAENFEQTTGQEVVLAVNGDYFDLSSGSNMESYVNDGVVVSKGSFATKHCLGFDNKGNFAVGRMTETQKRLLVVLEDGKHFFNIDKFNEQPADGEIAVYTQAGTFSVSGAGKYVVGTDSVNLSQFPAWGTSRRLTTGTALNDDSFTLKSGQFAVVVKGDNADFFFKNVFYGVEVVLVEIPDGDFVGLNWVLGGYDVLVDNFVVNTKCHTDNDGDGYAPRTTLGVKQDGSMFVLVVDGRQTGYSLGITVAQQAQLASLMGAKFALELDGGGSSTMVVRLNDELVVRNRPSDGVERTVSNALLLVKKSAAEEPAPDPTPTPDPDPTPDPTPNKGCFDTVAALPVCLGTLLVSLFTFVRRKGEKK